PCRFPRPPFDHLAKQDFGTMWAGAGMARLVRGRIMQRLWGGGLVLAAQMLVAQVIVAQEKKDAHEGHHAPAATINPQLAKLAKLAGTWVMADEKGEPTEQVASVIKLTAGGSVVHETLFPGQEMEMVSVYTVDS